MFYPPETGAAEVQCVEPRLPGHGYICSHAPRTWMWCRDCTAFEMERFRASPSLAVKHMLYSDFFPLKPPFACGMPLFSRKLPKSPAQVLKAFMPSQNWPLSGGEMKSHR